MTDVQGQRTDVSEPFVVTGLDFRGCTDSNPDLCACSRGGVDCRACNEPIKDGQTAVTVDVSWDDDATGEDTEFSMLHADCWTAFVDEWQERPDQ